MRPCEEKESSDWEPEKADRQTERGSSGDGRLVVRSAGTVVPPSRLSGGVALLSAELSCCQTIPTKSDVSNICQI